LRAQSSNGSSRRAVSVDPTMLAALPVLASSVLG
jgi:hypothetical protein